VVGWIGMVCGWMDAKPDVQDAKIVLFRASSAYKERPARNFPGTRNIVIKDKQCGLPLSNPA
jgi:hypothetical protein